MNLKYTFGGNITVNRLGYGGMQLTGSGVFGDVADRENAIHVLRDAVAGGVNFIDTAEAYGPQTNETLIADALSPYPKDVVIATKGGFRRPGPGNWVADGDPEFIRENIEGSLKRLKVKTIDLWQLHRVDPKVPVKETLGPVVDAVNAGKIRYVGLSEVGIDQIEEAEKVVPIASVQNLYNLSNRKWETVLDYTIGRGIAFIPWYPLASGPDKLQEKLSKIAEAYKVTVAQVALAWLLRRAENILLIPGTSSREHLKENLAAASVTMLQEDFEALSSS